MSETSQFSFDEDARVEPYTEDEQREMHSEEYNDDSRELRVHRFWQSDHNK